MRTALDVLRRLCAALLTTALAAIAGQAAAAEQPSAMPRTVHLDPGDVRSHIDSILRSFIDQPHAGPIDPRLRHLTMPASVADRVLLRLDADTSDATVAAIRATGATVRSVQPRYREIHIEATLDQIDAVARVSGVRLVKMAWRPIRRAGPGPDEADPIILTNLVRSKYAVNGTGQKIGFISDSIDWTPYMNGPDNSHAYQSSFTLTGSPPQAASVNRLPTSIQVVSQADPNPVYSSFYTDEGEAMMENAYSLAPGAAFAFAAANDFQSDTAFSVNQLSAAGCTVICDDIGWPDEPMFQDGVIAQACESFISAGGVYCSAAGNDMDQGTIMPFVDVVPGANDTQVNGHPNPNDLHNWGIGGSTPGFLPLVVQANDFLTVTLEWNQPYQSNGLGAGSQADFDLYLTSSPNFSNVLTSSTNTQGTAGHPFNDPVEVIQWPTNGLPTASTQTLYLAVDHVQGLTNCILRLEYHSASNIGLTQSPNYGTVLGKFSCYGHPAAADVLAIGAVWQGDPTVPEQFTAKGGWGANGLPFYFDNTGNAFPNAPVLRNKPDITAPDGCSTGNNGNAALGLPSFNPFFGTSDATPQAAAAAALIKSARPSLTNWQIINALRGTATDITAAPASAGADAWTGFGLVDAYAAAGVPITAVSTASTGTVENGTVDIAVTFAAAVTVTGTPSILLNTVPAESATYVSGSGTTTLTFAYAVQPGDVSADLAPASIQALQLNGGAINDTTPNANPAALALLQDTTSGAATGAALPVNGSGLDVDAIGPSVTIVPTPAISNQPSFSFGITFSRAVTSFTTANVTLANCALGTLTTNTAGLSYTLTVTASAPGALSVSVPAGQVHDGAGLGNLLGTASATYDITPPTLTITPTSAVGSNSSNTFTFAWSKAVSGFVIGDIALVNGSPRGVLGGSGATYTLVIASGAAGSMTITVAPTAGITDAAGNAFAAGATLTVAVNNPSSSKKCGLGIFGAILPMLWWMQWRRRAQRARR